MSSDYAKQAGAENSATELNNAYWTMRDLNEQAIDIMFFVEKAIDASENFSQAELAQQDHAVPETFSVDRDNKRVGLETALASYMATIRERNELVKNIDIKGVSANPGARAGHWGHEVAGEQVVLLETINFETQRTLCACLHAAKALLPPGSDLCKDAEIFLQDLDPSRKPASWKNVKKFFPDRPSP